MVIEAHTTSTPALSSSWATSNNVSSPSGIAESSHTSQGSQKTTRETSSTVRNEVIFANTTSKHSLTRTTPSARNESFPATLGLTWSRGSAHTQLLRTGSSNPNNYSARVSTSPYSAAGLGNGSFTTEFKSLSEWSPESSDSHKVAAVTSVPGPNGNFTTNRRLSRSSQIQSRAGAIVSTAAATEKPHLLATTASAKATTASITHVPSGLSSTKTSGGSWPAIISFCSHSDGVAIVGIGFITTLADGKSSITNTSPSQSLISASAGPGCAGEVAVSRYGLITTIQLSTLPSATAFSDFNAQIVTQSDSVIQYSPETISGYNNAQPIEISTNFVEVVDGHTTTQGGWWLIGVNGHIEVPKNRLWKIGKGIGCIGGPALCNMPCGAVDVGLDLFVLIDHDDCTPDETGPPGYPGGAVLGIDLTLDPPYPQDGEGSDDGEKTADPEKKTGDPEKKTADPEKKTATNEDESTTTSMMTSRSRSIAPLSTVSSASRTLSSSASAIKYIVVAVVGADQTNLEQALREFDPEKGGSYEPDVGDTSVSGGTWVDYGLNSNEAEQLSSRSDILALVTCCATVSMFGPGSSPPAPPQTVDSTVSLVTLIPSSLATLPASIIPKHRRGNVGSRSSSGVVRSHVQTKTKVEDGLQKRDVGTRLVRQKRPLSTYPENLSVFAWAPGVPSIAGIDYIFEETKGENTWVYLIDSGVAYRHWVCVRESCHESRAILRCCYQEFRNNWDSSHDYDKTNIDDNWIYGPGAPQVKADYHRKSHGTCMASRICGKRSGVAKQTTIIPVVIQESLGGLVSGLQKALEDIPERQKKGQSLPGKTVVSISLNVPTTDSKYITLLSDAIKGIMNLGVVVVCSAGNDGDDPDSEDWEAYTYPAALAKTQLPWLMRIGAVDNKGVLPDWAQKGDVYAPGVNALCANKDGVTLEEQSDGSSGATASIAGLIVYEMGKTSCPFDFSGKEEDYPAYQRITKQYYTDGPGAYVRPGGVWRVAWNGLDGRASTRCPLTVQKRDGEDDGEDDTCAQPSSASSSTTVQTSTSTFSTVIPSKPAIRSSSTTVHTSTSTFDIFVSSKPTVKGSNPVGVNSGNPTGGESASGAIASSIAAASSAAAAASSSASAAAASSSLAAVTAASYASAQAAESPSLTTKPPPSPITIGPPLWCTQLYVFSPHCHPNCSPNNSHTHVLSG